MNLLDVSPLASSRPHGVPEMGVAYSGQHCFVTLDVARGDGDIGGGKGCGGGKGGKGIEGGPGGYIENDMTW